MRASIALFIESDIGETGRKFALFFDGGGFNESFIAGLSLNYRIYIYTVYPNEDQFRPG